jgi:hypothetical protein
MDCYIQQQRHVYMYVAISLPLKIPSPLIDRTSFLVLIKPYVKSSRILMNKNNNQDQT